MCSEGSTDELQSNRIVTVKLRRVDRFLLVCGRLAGLCYSCLVSGPMERD